VLDRQGNPVTDLTAKDFEVFQNGARQNILSGVYIDNQSGIAAKPSTSRKDARNPALPLPASDLQREDTRDQTSAAPVDMLDCADAVESV